MRVSHFILDDIKYDFLFVCLISILHTEMLQLNSETLMIEYCAYSVVMNQMNSTEHMGITYLLSAVF